MSILLDFIKTDNMNKMMIAFSLMSLFFITLAVSSCTAAECDFGSVHAHVRISDNPWEDATAHPLFKRGESFSIQIQVVSKTILSVFFLRLHEYGTPVYEVEEGPTAIEQLFEYRGTIPPGQVLMYTWKIRVRPNTSWVNGYAPLEVFVQFNKNDTDERRITFDVVTAYILDEPWENYSQTPAKRDVSPSDTPSYRLPGFEIGLSIVAILLIGFLVRRAVYQRKN
jgi:sarcinarray family protein